MGQWSFRIQKEEEEKEDGIEEFNKEEKEGKRGWDREV